MYGVVLDGQFVYVLLQGQVARPDDELEVVPLVDPLQPVAGLLLKFAPEMDESCNYKTVIKSKLMMVIWLSRSLMFPLLVLKKISIKVSFS